MKLTTDPDASQLRILESAERITPFSEKLKDINACPLRSNNAIQTMQMNIGKVCNLHCKHCHVEAGPDRTELMSREIMEQCLQVMSDCRIPTLDITGGAPEMNPDFRWLIREATRLNRHVIIRTNLTILDRQENWELPDFYAEHQVEIVASLPYYSRKDTDRMRGDGVFENSLKHLKRLNGMGYGQKSGLILNLVYNPGGAFLPPGQQAMEADYRRALSDQFSIFFNHLFTIGNFPVGRFLTFLQESGNLQRYMEQLAAAFNPATVENVMCKDQISVSWDGYLYDCDFNQMLGLSINPKHISQCRAEDLNNREIAVHNHCYACTAGSGSSCGGAVV